MKKLLAFAALFAVVALTSCKYDDDDLWNSVHGLENRVAKLEELCKQMNTNISSLQTIVTALQNNVYVTGTTPLMKDGKEIGYTITFSKGNPITIYHGKDGQDGEDGITPTISVKKDTDGVYYWTLNGEFIVVDGGKIQAEGKDGTNGTTPQFKIENDYWFVSYNNGANWTQLGKATGEDGKDADSIKITQDENNVYFELADGTVITMPQNNDTTTQNIQFADPITKYLCSSQWLNSSNIDNLNSWDKNLDGELSYQEAANVKYIGYYHYFHGSAISSFNELRYFIGVTYIGKEAFKDCSKLYTIVIPDNVKTIEQNAFSGCSDLQFVTWGNNITDIQDRAFYGCTSLRFIILGDYVETIGAYAFYGASSINISTLRVTLPASVKSIGDYAFHNRNVEFVYCKSLTPPFLGGANVFGNDWGTSWKCKYYVPMSAVDDYKKAPYWKDLGDNIVGYDFTE